jgi:predicted nuclease with TOPRIM domain
MSVSDTEVVTVSTDGFSVEKRFEPDEFPVPAIAFVVRSDRETPTGIRLVDDLPDGVEPDDVGFHPEYGEEFWSVDQQRIVFERTFDPDETVTTVYGLRDSDLDSVEEFLGDPQVETVEAPDQIGAGGSGVVRDVIAGVTDTVTGSERDSDDEDGDEEEIVPLDLNDPGGGGVGSTTGSTVDRSAASRVSDGSDGPGGLNGPEELGVATALAAELRRGDVDEETAAVLADHLAVGGEAETIPNSTETRLRHVQGELADLRAYTDALEAFIDENGEAEQLLNEIEATVDVLQGRLDGVDDRVDAVDDRTEGLADRLADVEGRAGERFDAIETRVESVDERTERAVAASDDLEDGLVDVESEVDGLRTDLLDVEWQVDDLRSDAAVAENVEDLNDRLDELETEAERVESVVGRLDDLEADVDRLATLSTRLDDLEADIADRVDAVEADVAAFEGFRDRMASAFGAADPAESAGSSGSGGDSGSGSTDGTGA